MTTLSDKFVREYAVSFDWGIFPCTDLPHARRWVNSYIEHPEALEEGESLPVVVTRTITTSSWKRT